MRLDSAENVEEFRDILNLYNDDELQFFWSECDFNECEGFLNITNFWVCQNIEIEMVSRKIQKNS